MSSPREERLNRVQPVTELERTFVGNREFSNLPRKFKVSVSACAHRCAQHEINDIGLIAVDKDGVVGYDVWVGGGLGASAKMGRRLDVFALPEEAADVCRAITEIFRRALTRDPTATELANLKTQVATAATTQEKLEDVAAVVMASIEFVVR